MPGGLLRSGHLPFRLQSRALSPSFSQEYLMQGFDLCVFPARAGHRDDSDLSCKLVPDRDQKNSHSHASRTDLVVLLENREQPSMRLT